MKKKTLYTLLLMATFYNAYSQPPLPVTAGLALHLEAGSGYNDMPGPSNDIWHDKSGMGNDLFTSNFPLLTPANDPTFVPNSNGTGFPAIHFDRAARNYMESAFPANGWNSTSATIFVVRIGDKYAGAATMAHTLISIAEDHVYNNEFTLCWNESVKHHTSAGNWQRKEHQCSPVSPMFSTNLPVLETGVFRTPTGTSNLDYYMNGTRSTMNITPSGIPLPYTTVNRMIAIGTRFNGPNAIELLDGDILEIVAYNRALSNLEVNQVNRWLKQKYFIDQNQHCSTPVTLAQNCTERAGLVIKYLGNDGNGDCMFEADFIHTPDAVAGYSNTLGSDLDWNVGGTWTRTPAPFNFTVPSGTTNTPMELRGYFTTTTAGYPYCCDIFLQRTASCQSGTGIAMP